MSPAIEIRGLDSLRKRFAAFGALKELQPALRAEAETVAEEARAQLTERDPNSQLAQSIRIMALGTEDQPAYAVGSDDPAGFLLEFGTSRMRASPWLVPALHSRLPAINQAVRKVIARL